ncbi:hypothetical protein D3C81_1957040 [compost metagenome]
MNWIINIGQCDAEEFIEISRIGEIQVSLRLLVLAPLFKPLTQQRIGLLLAWQCINGDNLAVHKIQATIIEQLSWSNHQFPLIRRF